MIVARCVEGDSVKGRFRTIIAMKERFWRAGEP